MWNSSAASEDYRHKLVDVPQILADWYQPFGGIAGREVLEFGCGEGIMALGMALQHAPARIVGVDVLQVHQCCLPYARKQLGLAGLPSCLQLQTIQPGGGLSHLGLFDLVYSWSVFEHVSPQLLQSALSSVESVLKPDGIFFLQISPLYYSAFGSHLQPWVPQPWAHLTMTSDEFRNSFLSAPDASEEMMEKWSVYLQQTRNDEARRLIWETYETLNRVTAHQLEELAHRAGLTIVRDYRTDVDSEIPDTLSRTFNADVLRTEQIVWLLKRDPGSPSRKS